MANRLFDGITLDPGEDYRIKIFTTRIRNKYSYRGGFVKRRSFPANLFLRGDESRSHEINFLSGNTEDEKLIKKMLDRKIDLAYTCDFAFRMSESEEEG